MVRFFCDRCGAQTTPADLVGVQTITAFRTVHPHSELCPACERDLKAWLVSKPKRRRKHAPEVGLVPRPEGT